MSFWRDRMRSRCVRHTSLGCGPLIKALPDQIAGVKKPGALPGCCGQRENSTAQVKGEFFLLSIRRERLNTILQNDPYSIFLPVFDV